MNALESQVAVVTGAGRGAGEAIACRLAAMGAHVILVARSADQLNRVRERIVAGWWCCVRLPLRSDECLGRRRIRECRRREA